MGIEDVASLNSGREMESAAAGRSRTHLRDRLAAHVHGCRRQCCTMHDTVFLVCKPSCVTRTYFSSIKRYRDSERIHRNSRLYSSIQYVATSQARLRYDTRRETRIVAGLL